jgi:hypothetical protein
MRTGGASAARPGHLFFHHAFRDASPTSTAARSRGHHAGMIGLGLVLLVALAIPTLCIWAAIDARAT